MSLREITVGDQSILVEVADLKVAGQAADDGFENTSLTARFGDLKDHLAPLLKTLTAPVQAAFATAGAAQWSVELSIGFSGEAGIPFLASSEANAALKVTATWKKGV